MIRKAITLVSLAALSACSFAPKYIRPALPVPSGWPAGDAYLRQSEAALPSISYRLIFRDARLRRIVEQALANNTLDQAEWEKFQLENAPSEEELEVDELEA